MSNTRLSEDRLVNSAWSVAFRIVNGVDITWLKEFSSSHNTEFSDEQFEMLDKEPTNNCFSRLLFPSLLLPAPFDDVNDDKSSSSELSMEFYK